MVERHRGWISETISDSVASRLRGRFPQLFRINPPIAPGTKPEVTTLTLEVLGQQEQSPQWQPNITFSDALTKPISTGDLANLLLDKPQFVKDAVTQRVLVRQNGVPEDLAKEETRPWLAPVAAEVRVSPDKPARVIVTDHSPSMSHRVFQTIVEGVLKAYNETQPDINLYYIANTAVTGLRNSPPDQITEVAAKTSILDTLRLIKKQIGTKIEPERLTQILIFTDGEMFKELDDPPQVQREIDELATRGIEVKIVVLTDKYAQRDGNFYHLQEVLGEKVITEIDLEELLDIKDPRTQEAIASLPNTRLRSKSRFDSKQIEKTLWKLSNLLGGFPLLSVGLMGLGVYLQAMVNQVSASAQYGDPVPCQGQHLWGLIKYMSNDCHYLDFTKAKFNWLIPNAEAFGKHARHIINTGDTLMLLGLALLPLGIALLALSDTFIERVSKTVKKHVDRSPKRVEILNRPLEL